MGARTARGQGTSGRLRHRRWDASGARFPDGPRIPARCTIRRMPRRVLHVLRRVLVSTVALVVLLVVLLASCAGPPSDAPSTSVAPDLRPPATSRVTATPRATGAPVSPSPSPEAPVTPSSVPPEPTAVPMATLRPWSLAVVGDSIAYNHPKDCPGCPGLAARYAAAIEHATGRGVHVTNLSEYTGLRVEGLLAELRSDTARRNAIAGADVVLVTIAHNNVVCADWDLDRDACATLAEQYRATYAGVFAAVVALRAGRATAFRTINRYNDVTEPGTTEGEATGSKLILDAWNEMVCETATTNGFLCADVYHAFNGSDGLTPSGSLLAKDYTHPSDPGGELIAGTLADLGYAPIWP